MICSGGVISGLEQSTTGGPEVLRYQAEFLYPPLVKKLVLVNNLLHKIKYRHLLLA